MSAVARVRYCVFLYHLLKKFEVVTTMVFLLVPLSFEYNQKMKHQLSSVGTAGKMGEMYLAV